MSRQQMQQLQQQTQQLEQRQRNVRDMIAGSKTTIRTIRDRDVDAHRAHYEPVTGSGVERATLALEFRKSRVAR